MSNKIRAAALGDIARARGMTEIAKASAVPVTVYSISAGLTSSQ
jgi:DNA-binding phage protein